MPREQKTKPITPKERAKSARLKAEVEALAIKHLPYGLDSQAFYDSLEGDTELLWKLDRAGEAIGEKCYKNDEYWELRFHLSGIGERALAHLCNREVIARGVTLFEGLVNELLESEVPEKLQARPNSSGKLPHFFNGESTVSALLVLALHYLSTGDAARGMRAIEHFMLVQLRVQPTSIMDFTVVAYHRMLAVQFLTGCYESGLVDQTFVNRMLQEAWDHPPHWSLVVPGEVAFMAINRPDEPDLVPPQLRHSLTSEVRESLVQSIDPQSPAGRLFAGGVGMTEAELELIKTFRWQRVFFSGFKEQAEWELLGMDRLRRERGIEWSADPEAPAVSTWHLLWRMWWGSRETVDVGDGLACDQLRIGPRAQGRRHFHWLLVQEWNRLMVPETYGRTLVVGEKPPKHFELLEPATVHLGPNRELHHLFAVSNRIVARRRRGKRAKSRPRVRDGLLAWLVRPA